MTLQEWRWQALDAEATVPVDVLKQYKGTYEVNINNVDHKMIVSLENSRLCVEANNPADRLPKVKLYAESQQKFFIKEVSQLKFEFVKDDVNKSIKLVTYNNRGKDAEWSKIQ